MQAWTQPSYEIDKRKTQHEPGFSSSCCCVDVGSFSLITCYFASMNPASFVVGYRKGYMLLLAVKCCKLLAVVDAATRTATSAAAGTTATARRKASATCGLFIYDE